MSDEGKKGLHLKTDLEDLRPLGLGAMCEDMARLIEQNITDPGLRTWILPSFTTRTDRVVASVLMMGLLKNYL